MSEANGAAPQDPPQALSVDPTSIPDELKGLRRWVVWQYVLRDGKWTKPPLMPNGRPASHSDPKTWVGYPEAWRAYQKGDFAGIGLVVTTDDLLVGVDLDKCRDPETGVVEEWARKIIEALDSYAEVSPSGRGLRIWLTAKLPPGRRRKGQIEIYETLRYLTLTGYHVPGTPTTIENRQAEIERLHREIFGEQPSLTPRPQPSFSIDDNQIIELARGAKNGTKFSALFDRGDWQGQGFPSQSEADASLCSTLAFFSGGYAGTVDRLFRQSGLMRAKWDRPDYRERTINQALSQGSFYQPWHGNRSRPPSDDPQPQKTLAEPTTRIELWADDPLKIAEAFIQRRAIRDGIRTLHRWEEEFREWMGSYYVKRNDEQQEAAVARFIYDEVVLLKKNRFSETVPCAPKATHINETLTALQNRAFLEIRPPAWIGRAPYDLSGAITVQNGILLPGSRELLPPSPAWFTINALDVTYDADATCPQWESFLLDLWPQDSQSRGTLQEVFGYFLNCDMSQEKIFALIGPPRSGKSTITGALVGLLGEQSTSRLTLSSLAEGFERQALIGKTLTIIPDARMGSKTDAGKLLDVLLTISGRDNPGIPRKYRDAYEGPLYVRFLIVSNEIPRFPDSTGAAAKRFVILKTIKNFLGHEDTGLKGRLLSELPGILNWALDGWDRLQQRGHFMQPESALDEVELLANSSSPLVRFVGDDCAIDESAGAWAAKDDLYRAYLRWCEDQKVSKPLSSDGFFRKLKEAYPTLRDYRPRKGGIRTRYLMGIVLMTEQEKAERMAEEEKPDAQAE